MHCGVRQRRRPKSKSRGAKEQCGHTTLRTLVLTSYLQWCRSRLLHRPRDRRLLRRRLLVVSADRTGTVPSATRLVFQHGQCHGRQCPLQPKRRQRGLGPLRRRHQELHRLHEPEPGQHDHLRLVHGAVEGLPAGRSELLESARILSP